MGPVTVGANSTPRVQMLLAGTLAPQGMLPPVVEMNCPLAVTLVIGIALDVLLVTVTTCTPLTVPTLTLPKLMDVGDAVTAVTATPVRFNTSGLLPEVLAK